MLVEKRLSVAVARPMPETNFFVSARRLTAMEPIVATAYPSFPLPVHAESTCRIRFAVTEPGRVRLTAYDLRGRRVATLLDRRLAAGPQELKWEGRDGDGRLLASGVYLLRLEAGHRVERLRVALVR